MTVYEVNGNLNNYGKKLYFKNGVTYVYVQQNWYTYDNRY